LSEPITVREGSSPAPGIDEIDEQSRNLNPVINRIADQPFKRIAEFLPWNMML
jgi:hypothetical protein